tara:strand:+ start:10768 stop:11136 length:369 start_codon:yes stop_codon:yes gene_type:complete
MSCSNNSCSSPHITSSNFTCPQRMSDGRFCTNYYPRCVTYSQLSQNVPIQSSHDIRQYLQHNALQFMESQRSLGFRDVVGCVDCKGADPSTMHPERYVVKCNNVSCSRTEVNPNGLGDGRQY